MALEAHTYVQALSYFEALAAAEQRAQHSFFDQHVVADAHLGYFVLDEGILRYWRDQRSFIGNTKWLGGLSCERMTVEEDLGRFQDRLCVSRERVRVRVRVRVSERE